MLVVYVPVPTPELPGLGTAIGPGVFRSMTEKQAAAAVLKGCYLVNTCPSLAFKYAADEIHGPWEPGEEAIASEAGWAYRYSRFVLHRRWAKGEPALARDPYYGLQYSRYMIRDRWEPVEAAILAGPPCWIKDYLVAPCQGKWPEGQAALKDYPSDLVECL